MATQTPAAIGPWIQIWPLAEVQAWGSYWPQVAPGDLVVHTYQYGAVAAWLLDINTASGSGLNPRGLHSLW